MSKTIKKEFKIEGKLVYPQDLQRGFTTDSLSNKEQQTVNISVTDEQAAALRKINPSRKVRTFPDRLEGNFLRFTKYKTSRSGEDNDPIELSNLDGTAVEGMIGDGTKVKLTLVAYIKKVGNSVILPVKVEVLDLVTYNPPADTEDSTEVPKVSSKTDDESDLLDSVFG